MEGVSAETYARRCAEDELRAATLRPDMERTALAERIRALAFVGLLDREVAARILATYRQAAALRGVGGFGGQHHHVPAAQAPGTVRVAACTGEVEVNGSIVLPRLAVLGEQRARLAVKIRVNAGTGRKRSRGHRQQFFDVHTITLRDDKGRSVSAHLSGGGGGNEWRGWYETDGALSRDTAWLELDGVRLELHDRALSAASVESYDDTGSSPAERAARYLAHCSRPTSRHGHFESLPVPVIVETFVACGALRADSPEVAVALSGTGVPRALGRSGPARRRSPEGGLVVGATIGPLDGVYITVAEFRSSADAFRVDIDGTGGVDFGHDDPGLDVPRFAFDATDDVGNSYRGSIEELSDGSDGFSGTIAFEPPLADDATSVDLEFSTERGRAVVHVELDEDGHR